MSPVRVRPARLAEAPLLAEMANDLNDHVGVPGRPFTPERVRADGFGPRAAFTPLVAELDGAVVGYAFFSAGYNTDVASRSVWLHDLFVAPAARGRGVGSALMAAVAAETVRLGGVSLEWGVHTANAGALEFYRRLGAAGAEVRIMGVAGDRLRGLAASRGPDGTPRTRRRSAARSAGGGLDPRGRSA
jgi:GNAT superfamily N-acetyltransferase